MEHVKIVVQLKNRTVIKGTTNDFFPNRRRFHVEQMDGSITDVVIEDSKAIFFVKDYEGDKDHKDSYNDVLTNAGRKTKVKFKDGEIIYGYTLGYSPERQGFYLTPADLGSNNERIFIVTSATQNVQFVP